MTSNKPDYLPSVGRLLGFANGNCNKLADRRIGRYDLTIQQWVPLSALWRESPLCESDLADYCRMSASSLNRLIDRIEAKKLVRRSEDPSDRRRVLVELTPRGRKLSHLLGFYSEINDVLMAGMTARERTQLTSLLERVITNLKNVLDNA